MIAACCAGMMAATTSAIDVNNDHTDLERAMQKIDALSAQVEEQRREIDQLKAESDPNYIDEIRRAEISAMVESIQADVEHRTSLLQSGAVAGHDGSVSCLLLPTRERLLRNASLLRESSGTDTIRSREALKKLGFEGEGIGFAHEVASPPPKDRKERRQLP